MRDLQEQFQFASLRTTSPAAFQYRGPLTKQMPCFIVRDHSRQALSYLYCENKRGLRIAAGLLTRYEARRMPSTWLRCRSC